MKFGAPARPLPLRQRNTLTALLRASWEGSIPSHTELARQLGFSGASDVSRVVRELERKRLVMRLPSKRLHVTEAGVRVGLTHLNDDELALLLTCLRARMGFLGDEVAKRADAVGRGM